LCEDGVVARRRRKNAGESAAVVLKVGHDWDGEGVRACTARGGDAGLETSKAQASARAWHARRRNALAALAALHARRRGTRRVPQRSTRQAAAAILTRSRVQRLVRRSDADQGHEGPVRRDGNRPATVRVERAGPVTARVDQAAVAAAVRRPGGRGEVTKAPAAPLSLAQAVRAYRRESLIERDMGRLPGKPWSLTPMSGERADHATGWSRLRSSGLRVPTRLELVGRRRLAVGQTTRAGR
jgi:hypothetical protein